MEIVSKPDLRSSEQATRLCHQAPHHPALSRHLRRQYGGGLAARRRQCLGAPARRRRSARAARSRTSTRSASSARPSSMRRAGRSRSSRRAASIHQETRLFDAKTGETRSMRSKEEAHDYRYFPDPDLAAARADARLCGCACQAICPSFPTPSARASSRTMALTPYDADVLVAEKESADYFESGGQGPRRQAGGELGDQRAVRPPQQGRAAASSIARSARTSSAPSSI